MTPIKPIAFAGAAAAALVATVLLLNRPPSGPVEPAWDLDACAHCHMHVGEQSFAAQALLASGETLFFDDPGCLLLWQQAQTSPPVAVYFHHVSEPRWLRAEEAGFQASAASPMNWGLAAVDRRAPGALSVADATRRLAAIDADAAPGAEL